VLAAAIARDMAEFESSLRRIRYDHGNVQYDRRNHYFADWCKRNIENGICRPVAIEPSMVIDKTLTWHREFGKHPVSIVATISTVEKDPGVIGRKDKGILTPAHLNGKRIGVTLGTSGHFMLDALLLRHKLSTDDVMLHDLQPQELAEALLQGDVDAVATWEPYLGALRTQLGANGIIFYSEGIYELPFNIAGTRDYVVSHPEMIKKLVRALIRAERSCRDEPDAARQIIASAMNVSLEDLQEVWPTYRFNVTLDQSLLLTLEDETRWAIKNELTNRTNIPNYLDHVYLDALEAVMPTAVTVIH